MPRYPGGAERLITAELVSNTALASEAGLVVPAAAQWVVFVCAGRRFGVPLDTVSEILTPRPFTRLPGTGPEVCGLVGIRGRVLTVLDLGVVLGLPAAGPPPDHRLLLLDLGTRRIGAAVEEVAAISPALVERTAEESNSPVLGTGRAEDGAFTALDPAALTRHLLHG